jgi:hypothetical protein
MKPINILKKTFILLSLTSLSLFAQDFTKAGTSAAQFLKIPVGAKAVSMAGTFTSVGDDISALYWNPACIAAFDKVELGFSHSNWIADFKHNFLGFVLPLSEKSAVGFSVIQLTSGNIESTTIEKPQGTGTFYNATDLAISVSYSRYLIEQVSVGLNAKFIHQSIWNTYANTFAFDLGVVLHTGFYGMKMGLSFQNFGPELKMDGNELIKVIDQDQNSETNPLTESKMSTQPNSLPTSYRVSVSLPLIGDNAPLNMYNSSFVIATDAIHLNDNREHYSIGAEYGFLKTFFVRGGYYFNTDEEGLTLGSGIKLNLGQTDFSFDYAYSAFGVFGAIHFFSVGLKL